MKKLLILSGVALVVASSLTMAAGGNGKGKSFTSYDTNNDGVIVAAEATGKIAKHFSRIDTDGNGSITTLEFENMPKGNRNGKGKNGKQGKNKSTSYAQNFESIDANHNGEITEQEFATMLKSKDSKQTAQQSQRQTQQAERMSSIPTFAASDSNHDGEISEQEFTALHDAQKANNTNKMNKNKSSNGMGKNNKGNQDK